MHATFVPAWRLGKVPDRVRTAARESIKGNFMVQSAPDFGQMGYLIYSVPDGFLKPSGFHLVAIEKIQECLIPFRNESRWQKKEIDQDLM
jgi:hypothetical protein